MPESPCKQPSKTPRDEKILFSNSKADAKIFGKYSVSAIDASGATSEKLTDWPRFFFSRLFGYLSGEISEAEIIAEICA